MANLDTTLTRETREQAGGTALGDLAVVGAAIGIGLVTWVLWHLGGVELAVTSADDVREVGAADVVVTAVVVSIVGLGLLRLLEKLAPRGLRWWTIVASVVWAISFLGPLGATTAAAGLGLASLHLVVGAAVVLGARWTHGAGTRTA